MATDKNWFLVAMPLAVAAYGVEQMLTYSWFLNNIPYFPISEAVFRASVVLLIAVTSAISIWTLRKPDRRPLFVWCATQGFWLVNVLVTLALAARFTGYAPGLIAAGAGLLPALALSFALVWGKRLLPIQTIMLAAAAGVVLSGPVAHMAVSTAWLLVSPRAF